VNGRERVTAVLDRLEGVRPSGRDRWIARGRCHDDARASLSIHCTPAGRVLVHCFAGCRFDEILQSIGLAARDLAPSGPPPAPGTWPSRPRGLCGEAREDILALWSLSDGIRRAYRLATDARRVACQLGESERVWALLEGAARQETLAMAAEAEFDDILRGRIA
jgi:hypothetical protein